jgi:hypothetical protein
MAGTEGMLLWIAVPAALLGAASMGLASAAQARATTQVPDSGTLNPRLLLDLVRRPLWLIGIVATIAGLFLQVLALGFGPLMLVQPLLVTAVPFGSVFAAAMGRRAPDRVFVAGGLTCVVGLSAFLVLAQPTGGSDDLVPVPQLIPLALALGAVVAGSLLWAAFATGPKHVLGLALATGVTYGVTAGLMKVVAGELRVGPLEPFQHWTLYAVCVIGPVGFLLSQNTFQQGRLVSPALAVITTVDPLVGVAIGVWWMGESAATGPAVLAGEILAAIVLVGGIIVVARHAGHRMGEVTVVEVAAPEPRHRHDPAEPAADRAVERVAGPAAEPRDAARERPEWTLPETAPEEAEEAVRP